MSEASSVSEWIEDLKGGSESAAAKLWERFYVRTLTCAQKNLKGVPGRIGDKEDVAQEAFLDLFRGARNQRFPSVHDRDELWRLLLTITKRKANNLRKQGVAQKRNKEVGESALPELGGSDEERGVQAAADSLPTPAAAVCLSEAAEVLLSLLDELDKAGETIQLRTIALAKLEGYTVPEMVNLLGISQRKVERRLQQIRQIWEHRAPQ